MRHAQHSHQAHHQVMRQQQHAQQAQHQIMRQQQHAQQAQHQIMYQQQHVQQAQHQIMYQQPQAYQAQQQHAQWMQGAAQHNPYTNSGYVPSSRSSFSFVGCAVALAILLPVLVAISYFVMLHFYIHLLSRF